MSAQRELLGIPIASGGRVDINSGVARLSGVTWATHWFDAERRSDVVVLIVHPASNFMGHYLLKPLAEAGISAVGMATRYLGNDQMLLMENCVLDIGAAIAHLKNDLGYDRVVLVGNSGGGGLAAMYQSQAENPTLTSTPAGDFPDLTQAGLIPADELVMLMAHPGRGIVYTESLDAAIVDEADPFTRDAALDLYHPENAAPYSAEFLERYRAAQIARNRRITAWARAKLDELAAMPVPAAATKGVDDLPFVVHGTAADPRTLDASIEGTREKATTLWGDGWSANFSPVTLGHATSLRSWLSQWSYDESRANAFTALPTVSAPVTVIYGTSDDAAFPSHAKRMFESISHERRELVPLADVNHYFIGQPEALAAVRDRIAALATRSTTGVTP
ncbi:MAG: Alpha/beta hydrolase family protein [Subtercola sp.]|nr:Alpha/beta hydrolase family protein [Subtercola sp.]